MTGPLKGIRVLDLSRHIPGPLCTHLLTRLGATVVKVEAASSSYDVLRNYSPSVEYPASPPNSSNGIPEILPRKHSALFEALNVGKKGLGVDIRSPDGRELIKQIVNSFDIVVESTKPGFMDKLGLGYESLSSINPKLVYCSLSGYGATGPYSHRGGHDLNFQALAGLLQLTGDSNVELPPSTIGFPAAAVTGSMNAVIGILSSIIARGVSGKGQFVDISLTESSALLGIMSLSRTLAPPEKQHWEPRGKGVFNGGNEHYKIHNTKDHRAISIAALEPHFWKTFCNAIQNPKLEHNPNRDGMLRDILASKTLQEWMDLLGPLDICIEPVLAPDEVTEHPLHKSRQLLLEGDNSESHSYPPQLVFGPKFSSYPSAERLAAAPTLGEHSVEVLLSCGFSQEKIDELIRASVVKIASPTVAAAVAAAVATSSDTNVDTVSVIITGKPTQFKPMRIPLEKGKSYFWCSCGLSNNQPLCDGSHRGTTFKPVKVTVDEDIGLYPFCACRLSKNGPRCDGSHKNVVPP